MIKIPIAKTVKIESKIARIFNGLKEDYFYLFSFNY